MLTALGLALALAVPALAAEPAARYALHGQLRPNAASEDGRFVLLAKAHQTAALDANVSAPIATGTKAAAAAGCGPGGLFADGFEAGGSPAACWSSVGNIGLSASVHSVGTTDDMSFTLASNGQRSLWIEPRSVGGSTITANIGAGAAQNVLGGNARGTTISGGGSPVAGDPAEPAAGNHLMSVHYGTVRGGARNVAVGDTIASAFSVMGGGLGHIVWSGEATTLGGGRSNDAHSDRATVLGGEDNIGSGAAGVVMGGASNRAAGVSSTADGGALNCAGGDYSWAGGRRAKVRPRAEGLPLLRCGDIEGVGEAGDQGTFAWADSRNEDFVSRGTNQFLARAEGSVQFTHDDNTTGNSVDWFRVRAPAQRFPFVVSSGFTTVLLTTSDAGVRVGSGVLVIPNPGVFWATAGARRNDGQSLWDTTSDARVKHRIEPLQGAVETLLALRPVRYRYRPDYLATLGAEDREHFGFIAQELAEVWPTAVTVEEVAAHAAEALLQVNLSDIHVLTTAATRELALRQREQREGLVDLRVESSEIGRRLDRLETALAQPR
ncbi:MAG: tail fiber domain-containing protein [Aquimonas sp.]|nr:tail fiber domain-containing protein [Aquimonas sp.]